MITGFTQLPVFVRYLAVGVCAIALARFVNWAIYNWAYDSRPWGPWSKPEKGFPPRIWKDRLPVLGWWRLRRELAKHGFWYWLRPLAIELLLPFGLLWLYFYETNHGTLPLGRIIGNIQPKLHGQFLAHFILIGLMTIATFIDFDEKTIPDLVTIPGTVVGLLGAAFVPGWFPMTFMGGIAMRHEEIHALTPNVWNAWMDGRWGLAIGLAVIAGWSFAILDRRWIGRRGIGNAVCYFLVRLRRSPGTPTVLAIGVALMLATLVAWWLQVSFGRWTYLLSGLIGIAGAAGITWGVRIAARWGLQVEALGFGDVTLMAMIGTYVGWQAGLLIFFFAPMVAILIVVIQFLLTGDRAAPYGPYLCAATLMLIVGWVPIWEWAMPLFGLGSFMVLVMVACVGMMGVMLWIYRLIVGRPTYRL